MATQERNIPGQNARGVGNGAYMTPNVIMRTDEKARIAERNDLVSSPLLPTLADVAGHPDAFGVADHNVGQLLPGLTPDFARRVRSHYRPRDLHHVMGLPRRGTLVVRADSEITDRVAVLAEWFSPNLGANYVVADDTVPDDQLERELGKGPAVRVPYYAGPAYQDHPSERYWGPDVARTQALKDKVAFPQAVRGLQAEVDQVQIRHGVAGNPILPFEVARTPDAVEPIARARLAGIREMYQHAKELDPGFSHAEGIVIQQKEADGGYGTVMVVARPDGKWEIKSDKHGEICDSEDSAFAALNMIVHEGGGAYKITRYLDVVTTPSVGVYIDPHNVVAMPVTQQLIDAGSCVGGSSANALEDNGTSISPRHAAFMRDISRLIVARLAHSETSQGHIGLDFMVGGENEQRLIQIARRDAVFAERYAHELAEVAITECNPRYTSLSLSVQPMLRYLAERRARVWERNHPGQVAPREVSGVTYADLETMYGKPDGEGRSGGFAVWDFIATPSSVKTEKDLVRWIDETNKRLGSAGLFFLPRLLVKPNEDGSGTYGTSVVLGMRPTADQQNLAAFREVVAELNRTRSLDTL